MSENKYTVGKIFRKAVVDPGFLGAIVNSAFFAPTGGVPFYVMLGATITCAIASLAKNSGSQAHGNFLKRFLIHKDFTYGVMFAAMASVAVWFGGAGELFSGITEHTNYLLAATASSMSIAYAALMNGFKTFKGISERSKGLAKTTYAIAGDSTSYLAVGRILGSVLAGGWIGLAAAPFVAVGTLITLSNNMSERKENENRPKLWLGASGLVAGGVGFYLTFFQGQDYLFPALGNILAAALFLSIEYQQTGKTLFFEKSTNKKREENIYDRAVAHPNKFVSGMALQPA